ncbi:hypothetical protein DPMN_053411 [Dreissena polymorpha]|uniref:IRG-type G domain-containing protein n=1 Tax=Dreissena polymorpha TaxID=45954 RepID=A0A9D4CLA6_DREPO|nr:hypothetical protein DPMN_053411 [Dreissena polymorpha]
MRDFPNGLWLRERERVMIDCSIADEWDSQLGINRVNKVMSKSSFINAIRGIKHGDVGYAEESAGVLECTNEPTPYKHNTYPNIVFWDLPGRETYLTQKTLLELVEMLDRLSSYRTFSADEARNQ